MALQFVAPLGYLAVLLIFSLPQLDAKAWGYKLTARVSEPRTGDFRWFPRRFRCRTPILVRFRVLFGRFQVLLPFQAMILSGLAGLPSLPLPLFSYAFSVLQGFQPVPELVWGNLRPRPTEKTAESLRKRTKVRGFRAVSGYLDFLENYSYSVYVFQFLLYALWPQAEVTVRPGAVV